MNTITDTVIIGVQTSFEATFGPGVSFSRELKRVDLAVWDSLQHMILLVTLEGHFGIRFDGEAAARLNTIEKIAQEIQSRIKA